jgi:predicted DNA-binding transcriptional regulator AlpA
MNPPLIQNNEPQDTASAMANRSNPPAPKQSVSEAAQFLGLSVSTLNKMRLTGSGPRYLKLGRRVLYDLRHLEEWAATCTRSHTSE